MPGHDKKKSIGPETIEMRRKTKPMNTDEACPIRCQPNGFAHRKIDPVLSALEQSHSVTVESGKKRSEYDLYQKQGTWQRSAVLGACPAQ
jgi:hypothetical protein